MHIWSSFVLLKPAPIDSYLRILCQPIQDRWSQINSPTAVLYLRASQARINYKVVGITFHLFLLRVQHTYLVIPIFGLFSRIQDLDMIIFIRHLVSSTRSVRCQHLQKWSHLKGRMIVCGRRNHSHIEKIGEQFCLRQRSLCIAFVNVSMWVTYNVPLRRRQSHKLEKFVKKRRFPSGCKMKAPDLWFFDWNIIRSLPKWSARSTSPSLR